MAAVGGAPARPRVVSTSPEEPPQPPLQLEDLPGPAQAALLGQPHAKIVDALHAAAVAAGRDMYVDPASGLYVFTALVLGRRPCCGKRCRHCPYGHENTPEKRDERRAAAAAQARGDGGGGGGENGSSSSDGGGKEVPDW